MFAIGCLLVVGVAACSSTDGAGPEDEGATPNPDGKAEGAACTVGFDCRSGLCKEGKCGPSSAILDSSPVDGTRNGDETDVDCGGSRAGKCADGKACDVANDCVSSICKALKCVAPSPTDGAKNADESDVDCGGKKAPKCTVGKTCTAHADCVSDACAYDNKCVEHKGCTGHFGGDTCGEGETGVPGAKHESCCKTVDVADGPGGGFKMDKYLVTAGRMRAFVERWNGDLKKWAATNPPGWNQTLTPNLPENMVDVHSLLGPGGKRGCDVAGQGGRTFSQPPINGDAAEKSDFSKDVLDEKALNCVTYLMGQAVCAFDGGRLVSSAEMAHVYENRGRAGGATAHPWGWNDNSAYNAAAADIRVVHVSSYQTPNPPADLRTVNGQYPLDHAFWIAPPGRRPKGANMHGVQDAAGNMMPWVRDKPNHFVWTMSWEKHNKNLTPTDRSKSPEGPEGYYAIGVRCAR